MQLEFLRESPLKVGDDVRRLTSPTAKSGSQSLVTSSPTKLQTFVPPVSKVSTVGYYTEDNQNAFQQ